MAALPICAHSAGWEPLKPVEFVVSAGTGGGADQMARLVQGIVTKHKLMRQPLIVVNRPGGAGAEAFLAMKEAAGDPHKVVITLSNVFTTPLASKNVPTWRSMTPVAMLALDQFVLWVNAETPYTSAGGYLDAVRAAGPNKFRMGGTGLKQDDQIITAAIEKVAGAKFIYVPFKSGGAVALHLTDRRIDSSVNNPIEAVMPWRAGKLRALCVFSVERMAYRVPVSGTSSWHDIALCREAGIDVNYVALRGTFLPAGVTAEQTAFYVELFRHVRQTAEWLKFMEEGAFSTNFLTGAEFAKWAEKAEAMHRDRMNEAGFLDRE